MLRDYSAIQADSRPLIHCTEMKQDIVVFTGKPLWKAKVSPIGKAAAPLPPPVPGKLRLRREWNMDRRSVQLPFSIQREKTVSSKLRPRIFLMPAIPHDLTHLLFPSFLIFLVTDTFMCFISVEKTPTSFRWRVTANLSQWESNLRLR